MTNLDKKFKTNKKAYLKEIADKVTKSNQNYINKSVFTVLDMKLPKKDKPVAVRIDRPYNLETHFCYGYDERESGSYAQAHKAANNVEFEAFLRRNTQSIKEKIDMLEWILNPAERNDQKYKYLKLNVEPTVHIESAKYRLNCDSSDEYYYIRWDHRGRLSTAVNGVEMSAAQKFEYLDALKALLKETNKRCETWWKKYGKSHIKSWTFSVND